MRALDALRLRARVWSEARLLPLRIGSNPLSKILALADGPVGLLPPVPVEMLVQRVKRATRHPILMRDRRCLRQGVLAFRMLRAAGYRPELHFGIEPGSLETDAVRAHCWIVLEDEILLVPPEAGTVTILRHGPGEPA